MNTLRVRCIKNGAAQAEVLARFAHHIYGELFQFAVTRVADAPVGVTLICTGARFCFVDPQALATLGAQRAGFMAVRELLTTLDESNVWRHIKRYPKWTT